MDKIVVKKNIQKLIEKYEALKAAGKIKTYNEARTRNEFIEPLFEYLGWDMRNIENNGDVATEETISNKRVDLAFRISGIPKFYLEAKSLKTDLDIETYAKQAINYSWNKGVTWAILTDFESIKVFNSKAKSQYLIDKLVFEIKAEDYVSDFERLWLFSREAFLESALDKYAEKYGKKLKEETVNEKLYGDLKECRQILTHDLGQWNENLDKETLDEGVQKILDRLIFIRVLEDRGLESPILQAMAHQWEKSNRRKTLFQMLVEKFRELDKIYNSNLFTPHYSEEWDDIEGSIAKVIKKLYEKGTYEYNFKEIPADILGGVYENYLGYIEQEGKRVTKEEQSASRSKRKEHGIYYTPKYIVDFIVQNTLGEKLKEAKSIGDIKKIKVLDPACGSGSFLTRALEEINAKYKDFGHKNTQMVKSTILLENIYGVDLDAQAVELARLNLLIDALDKKGKLPNLTKNIREGNSLISGEEKELKKYFGKDWRLKKPFTWEEEFKEVHAQGGFDVIIGNPPWVSLTGKQKSIDLSPAELEFYLQKFECSNVAPNLFEVFIKRSFSLLNQDGFFSFVVPDRFCFNEQYSELRKDILEKMTIKKIWLKPMFPGIIADTVVFVIQHRKPKNNDVIEIGEYPINKFRKVFQKRFLEESDYRIGFVGEEIEKIFAKINLNATVLPLSQIAKSTSGCGAKSNLLKEDKEKPSDIKVIKGENIARYGLKGFYWFEFSAKNLTGRTKDQTKLAAREKVLLRKTGAELVATFDDSGSYPEQSLYFIYGTDKKILLYILGLMNSKLMNSYYHSFAVTNKSSTPQLKNVDLDKFPIAIGTTREKQKMIALVSSILSLNEELKVSTDNSNKSEAIKAEIEKTDEKIDQEVYQLYGLTDKEIKIIEGSS